MSESSRLLTDLASAADAAERTGTPLSVVLVAVRARGERHRRRVETALRTGNGLVYRLDEDRFVVLMDRTTAWDAFTWALECGSSTGGGWFSPRITCGVAGHHGGDRAADLLKRAAHGLAQADAAGVGAWLQRDLATSW